MRWIFTLGLIVLATGCAAISGPGGWRRIDEHKLFSFRAPANVRKAPSGPGIDSYLADYAAPGMRLSFDYYDGYGRSRSLQPSRVFRPRERPRLTRDTTVADSLPFRASLSVGGLSMYARCRTERDQDAAVRIFRTVIVH